MPATPSPTNPAGDDRNLVAADAQPAVTFADRLQLFWEKNATAVLALCTLVILGVAAKGLWDHFQRQRELDIGQDYAAATTPEQLKSFASSHEGHFLAGVAQLRLADDAYTAGKYAEAVTGYDQALAILKTGPLATRLQLGRAIARIQSGKVAEGSADLKQLLDDPLQLRAIRTEAGYHLASLAAESHNSTEVQAISDRLMQIDPSSLWTQRGMTLRTNIPVAPAAVAAPAATAPAAQPGETPSVQLKLPGK